jgi:hypothetical protein
VTVVTQWCYSGVTMVLQWCYSGVIMMFQWCYLEFVVDGGQVVVTVQLQLLSLRV